MESFLIGFIFFVIMFSIAHVKNSSGNWARKVEKYVFEPLIYLFVVVLVITAVFVLLDPDTYRMSEYDRYLRYLNDP